MAFWLSGGNTWILRDTLFALGLKAESPIPYLAMWLGMAVANTTSGKGAPTLYISNPVMVGDFRGLPIPSFFPSNQLE